MPFDLSTVGLESRTHTTTHDWKTLATYALGIGAKRDEIDYLYEGRKGGILGYPTFAVIPAVGPIGELMLKVGGDYSKLVHGGQRVVAHRPLPPSGSVDTVGKVVGIYDQKKFAQVVL